MHQWIRGKPHYYKGGVGGNRWATSTAGGDKSVVIFLLFVWVKYAHPLIEILKWDATSPRIALSLAEY